MTPLEPLYTLRVAAEMVPFVNPGALRDWLNRHREFPRRITPIAKRRHRMLLLSEIARIRAIRVKEFHYQHSGDASKGRTQKARTGKKLTK